MAADMPMSTFNRINCVAISETLTQVDSLKIRGVYVPKCITFSCEDDETKEKLVGATVKHL